MILWNQEFEDDLIDSFISILEKSKSVVILNDGVYTSKENEGEFLIDLNLMEIISEMILKNFGEVDSVYMNQLFSEFYSRAQNIDLIMNGGLLDDIHIREKYQNGYLNKDDNFIIPIRSVFDNIAYYANYTFYVGSHNNLKKLYDQRFDLQKNNVFIKSHHKFKENIKQILNGQQILNIFQF